MNANRCNHSCELWLSGANKGLVWVLGFFWATTQNPKGLQLGYFPVQTAVLFSSVTKGKKQIYKHWNKKSDSGESAEWLGKKEERLQLLLLLAALACSLCTIFLFLFQTTALVSLYGFHSGYNTFPVLIFPLAITDICQTEAGLFHSLLSSTPCTLWDGFSGKAWVCTGTSKIGPDLGHFRCPVALE